MCVTWQSGLMVLTWCYLSDSKGRNINEFLKDFVKITNYRPVRTAGIPLTLISNKNGQSYFGKQRPGHIFVWAYCGMPDMRIQIFTNS